MYSISTLDKHQVDVVLSEAPRILVVAGAGSGKTRVLTERVRRLLQEGVPAHNIVAITYTNMAAEEMKERLSDIDNIGDAFVGTIHSFANKIYKTSGVKYQILNSEIEQRVYYEVLHMPKYKDLTFRRWIKYNDLMKQVEEFKIDESIAQNFLLPSEQFVLNKCKEDVYRIYERDGIIDFKQLLEYSTEYFKSLGAHLEHLFVDELQDIDSSEYAFLEALNAENYFYVGDDWQAIYGWKGGDVSIFKRLVHDDSFKVYYLNNNYRNPKSIIGLGNQIIDQIFSRVIPKSTNAVSTKTGIITISSKSQKHKLVDMLKQDSDNLKDWFVLTRTNKEAHMLSDLLDDNEVSHLFIKKSDYSLAELKEAMQENAVKILTVHSAKGLESKKVILYGTFPIVQPRYMLNEDERKVMYVGVTRAEEELHIFN